MTNPSPAPNPVRFWNKIAMRRVFILMLFWVTVCPSVFASTQKPGPQQQEKTSVNKHDDRVNRGPENKNKDSKSKKNGDSESAIDWGDWGADKNFENKDFGVGIQGTIEAELSRLDKSNLLQNATGVATSKNKNGDANKKPKDLKKTMAELEAMEAKVKKEIEDDSEF